MIKVAHASHIVKDKSYEQYARRGGFTLNAINSAKAIARKNPAVSEETVATGMLRPRPRCPRKPRYGRAGVAAGRAILPTTTVIGLRDGTISNDGLDTFKVGYEFVRDEIAIRRDHLNRHPPSQEAHASIKLSGGRWRLVCQPPGPSFMM